MSKKLVIVSLICLGLGVGIWGSMKLSTRNWSDRQAELTIALSKNLETNGISNKEIADKAAACMSEALVIAATEQGCSADDKNVAIAMQNCIDGNHDMKLYFLLATEVCALEVFGQQ